MSHKPSYKASSYKYKRKKGSDGCMYKSVRKSKQSKQFVWEKMNSLCPKSKKSRTMTKLPHKKSHSAIKKLMRPPSSFRNLLRRPIDMYSYGLRGDKPLYKYVYWTLVNDYEFPTRNSKITRNLISLIQKVQKQGLREKVHLNSTGMSGGKVSSKWWDELYDTIRQIDWDKS
jgi:hypothetical protein